MKKTVLGIAALLLILTGCVSTKTLQEAVNESEARRDKIEKIEATIKNLNEDITSLNKELGDLRAEKERLTTENVSKDQDIASLKSNIANLHIEIADLKGEVARLKVKTGELSSEKEKEIANVKKTYKSLVKEMEQEIKKGEIKITRVLDKLSVNLVEKVLFDSGSSEIKPKGKEILSRVAIVLKDVKDKQIKIEGHTDDVPIGYKIVDRFPTNWELSTARATTVVRYLQETGGLDPKLLSAAGYSMYSPVAENETDEGRARNRRIEIVLLPLDIDRVIKELKE
ncbi:MAG: OmpA family protein [Thermodesulfobacteriota bacterium]